MANSFAVHDNLEDEDDCVIFKGSPLYTSLLQSGSLAEELEIEQTGIDSTSVTDTHKQSGTKYNRFPRWTSGRKIWNTFCRKSKSWLLPDMSSVYLKHHQEVINGLSASTCLEEDDQDFIKFYIQTSCNTINNHIEIRRILRLVLDVMVCLIAVSVYQFLNWNVAKKRLPWSSVILATVVPVVIFLAVREGRRYTHRSKCKTALLLYDDFVKKNEKIAGMVKKCLRLIQETELISRGFTLVSQKNPLSRLEGGLKDTGTRQCPVLRKLVFTISRQTVLFFREMTKKLFDRHPVSTELDIQGTYLAYEPIQSYGPCLQIGTEDAEHLHTITDGFSISALKGISHLFSLHQSEFMKALVLVQQERIETGKKMSKFEEVNILKDISTRLEEWTVSLQKSHDYHSCMWMNREPVTRQPRSQSDIEDIYVAVHSLDLHLQAALKRVRCLSELIQTLPDTGKTNVQVDDLIQHMQPIRAELESSRGCWEEGLNRIEKAAGKSSTIVQETHVKDSDSGLEETPNTEVPARKIEDYIIEDQVFEGFTDSHEIIGDYEWDRPLTAAEKEKQRREKEEALRMLSELKSVISVRAVETEKREKAAIMKMYPDLKADKNPTTLTPIETVGGAKLTQIDVSRISSYEVAHSAQNEEEGDDSCIDELPEGSYKQEVTVESANDRLTHDGPDVQNADTTRGEAIELKEGVTDEVEEDDIKTLSESDNSNELFKSRKKYSVISSQGVRRLRKSNMLDLSDSDLEEYPEDDNELNVNDDVETVPRLGLPLRKLIEDDTNDDGVEGVLDTSSDESIKFRLPVLTLQEKLETFSGANLGLTSEIAEKAVARSKMMGLREETTFGGDVYGECSSSNDGDDDDDRTENLEVI